MKGFTLIEVLIVIAIVTILVGLGLNINIDTYKGYLFRSERSVLVSTLERARSRAMNNYFETTHGVCYIAPNYIIFRGTTCAEGSPTNDVIPENSVVNVSGLSASFPVIFEQLSGRADEKEITLSEGGRTSVISINSEGTINW